MEGESRRGREETGDAGSSSRGRNIPNPSPLSRSNGPMTRSRSRNLNSDRGSVDSDRRRKRSRGGSVDSDRRTRGGNSSVDGRIVSFSRTGDDIDVSSRRRSRTARMRVTQRNYVTFTHNPPPVTQRNYIVTDNARAEARRAQRQIEDEIFRSALDELFAEEQALGTLLEGDEDFFRNAVEEAPLIPPIRPADRDAVERLPQVMIAEEHINNDSNSMCSICKDKYEVGEEARVMDCEHMYHKTCIFTWLETQHTCPLCRFQMPYTA